MAIDAGGVHVISLVQRDVCRLVRHSQAGEIVVNSRIEEAPYFHGVSAGRGFCSFLFQYADSGNTRLVVRYFDSDRAADEPVIMEESMVLGPTVSEDAVGVCGMDEVCIFCVGDNSKHSFPLPAGFVPYFQRPVRGVNVPAGQMPFAIGKGKEGWSAWIGGDYREQPVVLAVHPDQGNYQIHPLQEGSCICATEGLGIAVNQISHADFFGIPGPSGRFAGLKAGMPVVWDGSVFCCFQQTDSPSTHEIACWVAGTDPQMFGFEDSSCNEGSCCGLYRLDNNLLAGYLDLSASGFAPRGLKFACWSIV
ncbi:MAG TPA: hypothetical protein VFF39_07980 [Verrucomicrobiae bacterium]|nr:hypothetical protein [Verrucomicrobiae bacterium]